MPTDRTDDVLTAEERSDYDYADRRDYDPSAWHVDKLRAIIDRLSARLAAAVAAEREACAKVAESTVMTFAISQSSQGIQGVIANAIRGRGTP